jgi:hypothetical protein
VRGGAAVDIHLDATRAVRRIRFEVALFRMAERPSLMLQALAF